MKTTWSNVKKPELIKNLLFLEIAFGLLLIASMIWNAVIVSQGVRHGFTIYFAHEVPKEIYITRAILQTSWALCGVNGIVLLVLCRYIKKHSGLIVATGILGIVAVIFGIVTILAVIAVIKVGQSIKDGTIMNDKKKLISNQEIINNHDFEVEKLKLQIEIEKLKSESDKNN